MERYEIGEVVEWEVGNTVSRGIVYDDEGRDNIEIMLVDVNGREAYCRLKVRREILRRFEHVQQEDNL